MTPTAFREIILDPGLALLERFTGLAPSDPARVLLLAIAGQESGLTHRRQVPVAHGRGWCQFEKSGGVRGVLTHPMSRPLALKLCAGLAIPVDEDAVFEAIAWSDHLSIGLGRLLLWTDPLPLPPIGEQAAALDYYKRNWRPGRPHDHDWSANYSASLSAVIMARD